jgi:lipoprotein-releasing system permease protein
MELFIAQRYLRGKRAFIGLISTIGVMLGCFVLIVALSIANGFEKEVRDRIVGTLAHARIMQYHGNPILNPDSIGQIIKKVPRVTAVAPFISGKGGVEFDQTQEGVMIMGVEIGRAHV